MLTQSYTISYTMSFTLPSPNVLQISPVESDNGCNRTHVQDNYYACVGYKESICS